MITNAPSSQYFPKSYFCGDFTVESGDISGSYAADVISIPIDADTIAAPTTPTGKDFLGFMVQVRTSTGVTKAGIIAVYHKTGIYAGYLTLQEGGDVFAAGDKIRVSGSLVLV